MIHPVPDPPSSAPTAAARWRRLGAGDARHMRAHLLRLHPDDFADRFMGARRRHVAGAHVRSLDWSRVVVVGCWIGRSLRGMCELHPIDGNRAEIALSVERRFQRQGIGAELLRRVLLLARNRGSTVLELRCLANNRRIRRLVRRFQGQIDDDVQEASGTIHALPPNAATLIAEMAESADHLGRSMIRLWLRSAHHGWHGGRLEGRRAG